MALRLFADPFLLDMEREVSRAFAPYLVRHQPAAASGAAHHPFDVIEKPNSYSVVTDAPGFTPEDVHVDFHEGRLTVSGERKHETSKTEDKEGMRVHRSERTFSSFSRSFALPEDAKNEGITATLTNGVLTVDVPKEAKPPKPEPKRIKVSAA